MMEHSLRVIAVLKDAQQKAQEFVLHARPPKSAEELLVKEHIIQYLLFALEEAYVELDAVRHDFRTQARLAIKMMEEERAAKERGELCENNGYGFATSAS